MAKNIPPISALRALEAAARSQSFTKTAEELNVTQSAISHQIRHLEAVWGFELFNRQKNKLILTDRGAELALIVREFLRQMEQALDEFEVSDKSGSLKLSLLQSFAVNWLVPRLPSFTEKHPEIDVWISTKDEVIDFSSSDVDVAIRLGGGNYPGLFSEFLLREKVFPVCSPGFLNKYSLPKTVGELSRLPLLLRINEARTATWQEWFSAAGYSDFNLRDGARFPDTNMALQAALNDQGVALVRSAHVGHELKNGRLIKLLDCEFESPSAYFFICPQGDEDKPKVLAFRNWIKGQAKLAQQEYSELGI